MCTTYCEIYCGLSKLQGRAWDALSVRKCAAAVRATTYYLGSTSTCYDALPLARRGKSTPSCSERRSEHSVCGLRHNVSRKAVLQGGGARMAEQGTAGPLGRAARSQVREKRHTAAQDVVAVYQAEPRILSCSTLPKS